MDSSDQVPPVFVPPNIPQAPRPQREDEQLHHPRIDILSRLVQIPVISLVYSFADFSYRMAKTALDPLIQQLLAFVENKINSFMIIAIYAAGQSQTVLAADRSACESLDWTVRENVELVAQIPGQMVRRTRRNSTTVIQAIFVGLKTLIDMLIPGPQNIRLDAVRNIFLAFLATMYFTYMNTIYLIFPRGENALPADQRIHLRSQRIQKFTRTIIKTYEDISKRIKEEWNHLSEDVRAELLEVFQLPPAAAAGNQPNMEQ